MVTSLTIKPKSKFRACLRWSHACYFVAFTVIPLATIAYVSSRQPVIEDSAGSKFVYFSRRLFEKISVPEKTKVLSCVSWRETNACHFLGARLPDHDKDCDAHILGGAGYCLCDGSRTTARVVCGQHNFTCRDKCAELTWDSAAAVLLPEPLTCKEDKFTHGSFPHANATQAATWMDGVDMDHMNNAANKLWDQIDAAFSKAGDAVISAPGIRDEQHDWVWDGIAMSRSEVSLARKQWKSFMENSPPYPTGTFKGRGIVIVGGGLKYLVPAWVTVQTLRKVGCQLPVEIWFPVAEFPSQEMEQALRQLGVWPRPLSMRNLEQGGFSMKAAAIALSQFEEVLLLDSDNVPIRDVSVLFDSPEYRRDGAIMWPDYWDNYAAPEVAAVLELNHLPQVSFESGQLLVNKARHWKGIMLAIFMNEYHTLYYELLTSYMGKGDKDSFGYAFLAAQEPFHVISHPVGGLGLYRYVCPGEQDCEEEFRSNTMVQHDPQGNVLFLHTNAPPKWSLQLPRFFKDYSRRWQSLQPQNEDFVAFSNKTLGFDLEHFAFDVLQHLRCAPFFNTYVQSRMRMGEAPLTPLDGFHSIVDGTNFKQHYRHGVSGTIMPYFNATLEDHWMHFKNGHWRRAKASFLHYMKYNVLGVTDSPKADNTQPAAATPATSDTAVHLSTAASSREAVQSHRPHSTSWMSSLRHRVRGLSHPTAVVRPVRKAAAKFWRKSKRLLTRRRN